jgi:ribonuclease BN (tRNA processing enzyme)
MNVDATTTFTYRDRVPIVPFHQMCEKKHHYVAAQHDDILTSSEVLLATETIITEVSAKTMISTDSSNHDHDDGSSSDLLRHRRQREMMIQYTLMGRSRAGDGTSWVWPEEKIVVDVGARVMGWIPHIIFLTHTHDDHIHDLTTYVHARRRRRSCKPSKSVPCCENKHNDVDAPDVVVYVPASRLSYVASYLHAHRRLCASDPITHDRNYGLGQGDTHDSTSECHDAGDDDDGDDEMNLKYELRPIRGNEELEINATPTSCIVVRTYSCHHRMETIGYQFFRKCWILHEKYQHWTAFQIKQYKQQLKNQHQHQQQQQQQQNNDMDQRIRDEMMEMCYVPLFTLMGDTTPLVFDQYPMLLSQTPVVVTECTFLTCFDANEQVNPQQQQKYQKVINRATISCHTHWMALQPYVVLHPITLFCLTHMSLQYSFVDIRVFFNRINETLGLYNVHPMIDQDSVQREYLSKKQQKQHSSHQDNKHTSDQPCSVAPTCNCRTCTKGEEKL